MSDYDSDIAAVLGEESPPPPRRGRPPGKKKAPPVSPPEDKAGSTTIVEARNGVTVYWLAQVFGMTPENVRRRLGDCPPLAQSGKGYRYDIKTAASYLVDPKIDIEKYLKQLRATDLPASLQKEIWDARLKRQKWEVMAGELWHTQDVMSVLSRTFATIKSTAQLWPDTIERQTGLTEDQRELLIKLSDSLQDEIYQGLQEMVKERGTKASIYDLEAEADEAELEDVL